MIAYMNFAIIFMTAVMAVIVFMIISLLYIARKGISDYIDKVEAVQNKVKRGALWRQ